MLRSILLSYLILAPIPKDIKPTAPLPRVVSFYYDDTGVLKSYTRQYWDNGVLRNRYKEGDPELETRVYPDKVDGEK